MQTEFNLAQTVLVYMDFRNEVQTKSVIEYCLGNQKTVGIPKIEGNEINFYSFSDFSKLETGSFGVLEPRSDSEKIRLDMPVCVIVPCVAFDFDKSRMGYGKGFYDRFFERNPMFYRIGVAFDMQEYFELPREAHDIEFHKIITESRIIE